MRVYLLFTKALRTDQRTDGWTDEQTTDGRTEEIDKRVEMKEKKRVVKLHLQSCALAHFQEN